MICITIIGILENSVFKQPSSHKSLAFQNCSNMPSVCRRRCGATCGRESPPEDSTSGPPGQGGSGSTCKKAVMSVNIL